MPGPATKGRMRKKMKRTNATLYKRGMMGNFKRALIPAVSSSSARPQAELKSCDINAVTFNPSTASQPVVLNAVQQGAAFYNRIGNKINMKSLEIRCVIQPGAGVGVANANQYIRLLIIYDNQPNGGFPTWADVMTTYNPAGSTESIAQSFLNINNRNRFKVFADITITLNDSDTTTVFSSSTYGIQSYSNETNVHRFIKLKGAQSVYKTSTGAIGDLATGALLFFPYSNLSSTLTAVSGIFTSRLRYYDQ